MLSGWSLIRKPVMSRPARHWSSARQPAVFRILLDRQSTFALPAVKFPAGGPLWKAEIGESSAPSLATISPDVEKQIKVTQLQPGMYVHKLKGSWMGRLLWQSEFLIANRKEIQIIVNSGVQTVWIDTEKGIDVPEVPETPPAAPAPVVAPPAAPAPQAAKLAFDQEIKHAARLRTKAKQAVGAMFTEARMGKALDADKAQELVGEIAASVERNPAALISLARLKTKDDYTYMHSVAVCGLMVSLARELGLDQQQTRAAGVAGLLHDIGKMAIPLKILNKPGKLTDEEYTLVKTHPAEGHKLLLEGNGVSEVALDVCLHHHERIDGKGYPERLKGDEISLFAKMGAVCDVYDAITSNRPYKNGWDPAESLRKMAGWSQGDYEAHVFQAFVKCIGIYPTGSLLLLESGRLCVVVEQGEHSLLQPRVKVFFSTKSDTHIKPELIDLSQRSCGDAIVGPQSADKWGLKNLDELWAGDALR